MRTIRFHPEAESEMLQAAAWYEERQVSLGRRFLIAVQDALNRVQLDPKIYPVVEGDVRRCLTKTFPFGVLFRTRPDSLEIMAAMHLRRDPGYWRERTLGQ